MWLIKHERTSQNGSPSKNLKHPKDEKEILGTLIKKTKKYLKWYLSKTLLNWTKIFILINFQRVVSFFLSIIYELHDFCPLHDFFNCLKTISSRDIYFRYNY